MTGTHQAWLVAVREMRERGRSPAFLLSVGLMLVAVAIAVVLPALFDEGPGTKEVGLAGAAPPELAASLKAVGEGVDTTVEVETFATVAGGEQALRDGEIDVLVVDGRRLEWQARPDEQLKSVVTGAIQLVAVRQRAAAAGIDPDRLLAVMEPVPVDSVELGRVAGRTPEDEAAAMVIVLVLFGAINAYGAMVLSGVVEEKSSRTVEVLLARMPARNLLAGKIAGIGLLRLGQIVATALVALTAGSMVDSIDISAVSGGVMAWAVAWFVLGYALYATIFGTLGSLASRTEDTSSIAGPVSIVLILGFVVAFAGIGSADAAWVRVVSWVPLFAPLAMPIRIAMGVAAWWEPVVAAALALAAIAGFVGLGGRVYTRAILHTGARLSLGDAWRGSPAESRTAPADDGAWPAADTDHEPVQSGTARLRFWMLAGALALGGVVFALTGDFVVGVAVGAIAYTLAVRAEKAWGRHDRLPDTSREDSSESVSR